MKTLSTHEPPLANTLIERWLARETTQPLLLYGPVGAGKKARGLWAAQVLNCSSRGAALAPCNSCAACKKISHGNHPDVRVVDLAYQAEVRGEPVEKQQFLRIETILEERKRLYQTVMEGPWKVSLIVEAHRLTADAANVLLKVLEEPPARTAIFLITPYRDRLFSTILSRCQPVRFSAALQQAPAPVDPTVSALWATLPKLRPSQILGKSDPRARVSRPEVEAQLQALMGPATEDLYAGRPEASQKIEWIQQAQQQLRQNVPPSLVYDHLLIKLASASHS